jgi:hypothetical protein
MLRYTIHRRRIIKNDSPALIRLLPRSACGSLARQAVRFDLWANAAARLLPLHGAFVFNLNLLGLDRSCARIAVGLNENVVHLGHCGQDSPVLIQRLPGNKNPEVTAARGSQIVDLSKQLLAPGIIPFGRGRLSAIFLLIGVTKKRPALRVSHR